MGIQWPCGLLHINQQPLRHTKKFVEHACVATATTVKQIGAAILDMLQTAAALDPTGSLFAMKQISLW
jgi:hypothetical protein